MANNRKRKSPNDIEASIGKETLDATDMGEYLGVNERTVKKYLTRLRDKFKKDYSEAEFNKIFKSGVKYVIPPEFQKLFICYYAIVADEKHLKSSQYRNYYAREIMKTVESVLGGKDLEEFQNKLSYKSMYEEAELMDEYFLSWFLLNDRLFRADVTVRNKLMKNTIKFVNDFRKNIVLKNKQGKQAIQRTRLVLPPEEFNEYFQKNIEDALMACMLKKMKYDPKGKSIDELLDNLLFKKKEMGPTEFFEIDKSNYKRVCGKIDQVFGESRVKEEQDIAQYMKELIKELYIAPFECECQFADCDVKETVYKKFMDDYKSISDYLVVVNSKEYKEYLKIRDTKEFKEYMSSKNKEAR